MLAALAVALFAVIQSVSAAPALKVTIDDSDNRVAAGTTNKLSFAVTGDDGGSGSTYTAGFVVASNGIVFNRTDSDGGEIYVTRTDQQVSDGDAAATATELGTVIYPPNASGEYTISVRATKADADPLDATLTIKVGEAGDAIGAATVSLGKVAHSAAKTAKTDSATTAAAGTVATSYDTCTDADGSGAGTDSDPGCIAVTVKVLNSLGEAANPGDVTGIHVFAPLATIYSADNPTAEGSAGTLNIGETFSNGAQQGETVGANEKFYIAKATAGVVDVSAIILGAGNATSEVLTLTFTGTANSIALGDPSSPLSASGEAYIAPVKGVADDPETGDDETVVEVKEKAGVGVANIEVNASDKAGNPAPLTAKTADTAGDVVVEVTNADGDVVETITDNQRSKPNSLTLIVEMVGADAEPGTYTVTVTLGDDLDEQTTEIVVAGKVANVEAEVSQDAVAVGDIITVTATVTDADGNLQPDAGTVMFQAVGSLKLTGLGAAGTSGGHAEGKLDDGVATGRFVVVDGSGTATIIASVGDVDGVTSVSSEAAEAMADEEASVACLSNLAGFATWACGVESSASEIFGLVSGRGATALHLWNGSAWVRYSVVDGTMVPGSSDFMVAENDILYISN